MRRGWLTSGTFVGWRMEDGGKTKRGKRRLTARLTLLLFLVLLLLLQK